MPQVWSSQVLRNEELNKHKRPSRKQHEDGVVSAAQNRTRASAMEARAVRGVACNHSLVRVGSSTHTILARCGPGWRVTASRAVPVTFPEGHAQGVVPRCAEWKKGDFSAPLVCPIGRAAVLIRCPGGGRSTSVVVPRCPGVPLQALPCLVRELVRDFLSAYRERLVHG